MPGNQIASQCQTRAVPVMEYRRSRVEAQQFSEHHLQKPNTYRTHTVARRVVLALHSQNRAVFHIAKFWGREASERHVRKGVHV
jgi:hypothetical protein